MDEPSRRELNKLLVRESIERSSVDVVAELGLDGASIDEICARAMISSRTFFNYFHSKTEAVLGVGELNPPPERLAALADPGDDLLGELCSLIGDLVDERREDALFLRRLELFAKESRLAEALAQSVARLREVILEQVNPDGRHREAALVVDFVLAALQSYFWSPREINPDAPFGPQLLGRVDALARVMTKRASPSEPSDRSGR